MSNYINIAKLRKDLRLRQSEFGDILGIKQTYVSELENGKKPMTQALIDKLTESFPNCDISQYYESKSKKDQSTDESNISEDIKYRLVPILNLDSVGGIHSANQIVDVPERIIGYEPFSDALKTDKCLVESGDSMTPTIPAGSLMLIREVPNWREYFGYGNVFVILLNDGRRITKEVTRYEENAKEYVWCKSHNPLVPDEELPKSMIVSVWKVIKVLTNKGW